MIKSLVNRFVTLRFYILKLLYFPRYKHMTYKKRLLYIYIYMHPLATIHYIDIEICIESTLNRTRSLRHTGIQRDRSRFKMTFVGSCELYYIETSHEKTLFYKEKENFKNIFISKTPCFVYNITGATIWNFSS